MTRLLHSVLVRTAAMLFLAGTAVASELPPLTPQWPQFRGDGSSTTSLTVPSRWSEETNVAWRVPLPGIGQSSPVVWNQRVFLTAVAGPFKETLHLISLDLNTGEELWSRQFASSFPEKDSDYISKAAPTAAVDERAVYALFESGDLIALDHEGTELWRRELTGQFGRFEGNHGQGASPVLTIRAVIVLMDHKGQSFLAAFDKRDGGLLWRVKRESSSAWSTPLVLSGDDRHEIIVSASGSVSSYHPDDGRILWTVEGLEGNNVPSPSYANGLVVIGSRTKGHCMAIRLPTAETGESARIAWRAGDATSAFGSPLIHQGRVYFVSDAGIAYCHDLEDGRLLWDHRIAASTWASPLGAGDRVWFFSKNGQTAGIQAADEFRSVEENSLSIDSRDCIYGYAIAPRTVVFRTGGEAICVRAMGD